MEQEILRTVSGLPEWEQVTAAGAGSVAWLGRISVVSRGLMQPSVSPWAAGQEDEGTERWAHLCPCASLWAGDPPPVWHISDRKGCHERVSLDTPEARGTDGDITSFTASHQPGGSLAAHGSLSGSCAWGKS